MKSLSDILDVKPDTQSPPDETESLPDISLKTPAKTFCRQLLNTVAYRVSLLQRMTLGTLPPPLEVRLWDYAYGKPAEKVDINVNDKQPSSPKELRRRAAELFAAAQELTDEEQEPQDPSVN